MEWNPSGKNSTTKNITFTEGKGVQSVYRVSPNLNFRNWILPRI